MKKWGPAIAAVVFVVGCSSGPSDAEMGYDRDGWDQAAMAELDRLKDTLAEGDIGCEEWGADSWQAVLISYKAVEVPMPLAAASCVGVNLGGEDLLFEIFTDAAAKDEFIETKEELLCERGAEVSALFPGLPYVDGGTWILEPDSREAAARLADLYGLEDRVMCTELPPPPTFESSTTTAPGTAAPSGATDPGTEAPEAPGN